MKPFIGMRVHYYPRSEEQGAKTIGQPWSATVTCIWSDACVNLSMFDCDGLPRSSTSVTLYPRATLDDNDPEAGCAYMLTGDRSDMDIVEYTEMLEQKNEQLISEISNLQSTIIYLDGRVKKLKESESRKINELNAVCELLGVNPVDFAPAVAEKYVGEVRKNKGENLCGAEPNSACRDSVADVVDEKIPRVGDVIKISGLTGKAVDFNGEYEITETEESEDYIAIDENILAGLKQNLEFVDIDPQVMPDPPIKYRAHAKVMRSYDYNHFEISLSCDDLSSLIQVDELRKHAARLAEKGVDQFIKQKEFEAWKINNRQPNSLSREVKEIEANYPESEWTAEQKAKVKVCKDRQYWLNRDYDFEDEWEFDPEEI